MYSFGFRNKVPAVRFEYQKSANLASSIEFILDVIYYSSFSSMWAAVTVALHILNLGTLVAKFSDLIGQMFICMENKSQNQAWCKKINAAKIIAVMSLLWRSATILVNHITFTQLDLLNIFFMQVQMIVKTTWMGFQYKEIFASIYQICTPWKHHCIQYKHCTNTQASMFP